MKISKEIKIYVVAVIIVLVSSPLIYWVIQNQMNPAQNTDIEYIGHHEQQQDYIRFWTDTQPGSWSGMTNTQTWSFTGNLTLKATLQVTGTGSSTFYTEIILVNQGAKETDVDEGFGFQITNSTGGYVRIRGWSWIEEDESFTQYTVKPTNTFMNLTATKIGTSQINYYVDNDLLGRISSPMPQQEGVMNLSITNGNQGGLAEIYFKYQVQQEA